MAPAMPHIDRATVLFICALAGCGGGGSSPDGRTPDGSVVADAADGPADTTARAVDAAADGPADAQPRDAARDATPPPDLGAAPTALPLPPGIKPQRLLGP